jgi:hypothetical protein
MWLLGQMIGGLLIVAVITRGLLFAFRRHRSPGLIVGIHVGAAAICVVLYGLGNADGGPWNPALAPVIYGLPAFFLCMLALYGDRRARDERPYDRIPDTFD